MVIVPDSHKDLLSDNVKAYAYLATLMPNQTPQLTPVWFNWDGTNILINSAQGRVKDRNIRKNPAVAVLIQDPQQPLRFIQIRGKVTDINVDNANEHINFLSMKYDGIPWKNVPGQVRVIYRILPEHVSTGE